MTGILEQQKRYRRAHAGQSWELEMLWTVSDWQPDTRGSGTRLAPGSWLTNTDWSARSAFPSSSPEGGGPAIRATRRLACCDTRKARDLQKLARDDRLVAAIGGAGFARPSAR